MAKTYQTARMSTGGKAPSSQIGLVDNKKRTSDAVPRRATKRTCATVCRVTNKTVRSPPSRRSMKPYPRQRKSTVSRDIGCLQNSTKLSIPKAPFKRLVEEISQDVKIGCEFEFAAITHLHGGAEKFMVQVFKKTNQQAKKNKRVTIKTEDLRRVLQ